MIVSLWWLWGLLLIFAPIIITLISAFIVGVIFNTDGKGTTVWMIRFVIGTSELILFFLFIVSVIKKIFL